MQRRFAAANRIVSTGTPTPHVHTVGGGDHCSSDSSSDGTDANSTSSSCPSSQEKSIGSSAQNASKGGKLGNWCASMFPHSDSSSERKVEFCKVARVGIGTPLFRHFSASTSRISFG